MTYVPPQEQVRKILLLYIVDKFQFPLTEDQFIKIILENDFMTYLDYKCYINELVITKQVYMTEEAELSIYKITEDGKFTLNEFSHLLTPSAKDAIDEYLEKNHERIETETLLDSSYKYTIDGNMEITCNIRERDELLMSIKVLSKNEDEAKQICNNWNKTSPMIYRILMDTFLQ